MILCIQLFLEVLPEAQSQWVNKTVMWRKQYEELKDQASQSALVQFLEDNWWNRRIYRVAQKKLNRLAVWEHNLQKLLPNNSFILV